MKRKLLFGSIAIVILAVAVFGVYYYAQARKSSSAIAAPQTVAVSKGDISTSVSASGNVRALQSETINWQTSGAVKTVNVKVGDTVTATQLLAELDPASVSQSVLSAQADLADAQKALDDLLNSQTSQVEARQAVEDAQKALVDYTTNYSLTLTTAQSAVVTAQANLTTMTNRRIALNNARASQGTIDAAEANYMLMQDKVKEAQRNYNVTSNKLKPTDPRVAQALIQVSDAEKQRDAALATLNWYLGKPTAADIAAADVNLAQAKATLADAEYNLNLIKDGPDEIQVALLNAKLADAQRAYNNIKDGPDASDVAAAKARVASAQAAVNQAMITAPFNGIVTELKSLQGDQVSNGEEALRIDDLSHLLVDLQVTEVDISNVKVGQPATMTFDAISGKTYEGQVTDVSMIGTSTQGVVQFGVTVSITNADAQVKPGMTASVSIVTQKKADALLVPNKAVHAKGSQRYVIVLYQGQQVQVPVTVGLTNDTSSEITSNGLKVGDQVVVSSTTSTTTTTTTTNNNARPNDNFGGGPGGVFVP